jgi:hypothetical protein
MPYPQTYGYDPPESSGMSSGVVASSGTATTCAFGLRTIAVIHGGTIGFRASTSW